MVFFRRYPNRSLSPLSWQAVDSRVLFAVRVVHRTLIHVEPESLYTRAQELKVRCSHYLIEITRV